MKYTRSLTKNHLFQRLYRKGASASDSQLVLYVRGNGGRGNRLGLTVSTKVGKAVVRNRVRRRLREIYRLNEHRLVRGRDVVVVARVRAAHSRYAQLERSFLRLADKLELLKKDAPKGEPS